MRSQVMIEQLTVKALRLFGSVEKQAVLCRSLCTEIVGFASYRDDQVVVRQASLRDAASARYGQILACKACFTLWYR